MQLFTKMKFAISATHKFKSTLLIFLFIGISNFSFGQHEQIKQSPNSNGVTETKSNGVNVIKKPEAQLKQERAKLMKELCPNHPAYRSKVSLPGASVALMNEFENWKKNYPVEYAAYLKIFGFKAQQ